MYQKLALGGIGGLTPLIAVILIADAGVIQTYLEGLFDPNIRGNLHLIGYMLKAALLFGVGAFWAYLHKTEQNNLKIYQLGIVAPAMILGTLTAHDAKIGPPEKSQHASVSSARMGSFKLPDLLDILIPSAVAQPAGNKNCTSSTCNSQWYEAVVDGFFARPPVPQATTAPRSEAALIGNPDSSGCTHGTGKNCVFNAENDSTNLAILKILLESPNNHDLRVLPPANSRQINRARTAMSVPKGEQVLGFINATYLGDGDQGMIFGSRGIYYHTQGSKGSSVAFVPYEDFSARQFSGVGTTEVNLGNDQHFSLRKSSVSAVQLTAILQGIKALSPDKVASAPK